MKLGLQDIDWAYIGARFAQADDNEQAEFFKSFCKECASWGTEFQIKSQLAGVNQKLSVAERDLLGMLSYQSD